MKFYLIACILLLSFLLLPQIRIFLKRIHLFARLRSVYKKHFKLVGAHFFWLFGRNKRKSYDFTIETPEKRYSVKLFSVKNPLSSLIFLRQGGYRIRSYFALRGKTVLPMDSKYREMNYQFEKDIGAKEDSKEVVPVLLIQPNGKEILYQTSQNRYKTINSGETIHGMAIFSLSELICHMKEEKNESTAI